MGVEGRNKIGLEGVESDTGGWVEERGKEKGVETGSRLMHGKCQVGLMQGVQD